MPTAHADPFADAHPPLPHGPAAVFGCAYHHRSLIFSLVLREVRARYKGSILGGLWLVLLPVLMLAVYGTVFGLLFKSHWTPPPGCREFPFMLIAFSGLIFVNMFTDCLSRAPGLMMENAAYIKRVVFPLEVLPWVALGTSLFTVLPSLVVLAVAYGIYAHVPPWTVCLLPAVVCPLMLTALGVMWFLGALGVYLRDLKQVVTVIVTVLTFLSPTFYPMTIFPPGMLRWVYLNPLTLPLEQIHQVVYWGQVPDWRQVGAYFIISWLIAWGGLVWFAKTYRGFADVV